jgi:hypothetical protein
VADTALQNLHCASEEGWTCRSLLGLQESDFTGCSPGNGSQYREQHLAGPGSRSELTLPSPAWEAVVLEMVKILSGLWYCPRQPACISTPSSIVFARVTMWWYIALRYQLFVGPDSWSPTCGA